MTIFFFLFFFCLRWTRFNYFYNHLQSLYQYIGFIIAETSVVCVQSCFACFRTLYFVLWRSLYKTSYFHSFWTCELRHTFYLSNHFFSSLVFLHISTYGKVNCFQLINKKTVCSIRCENRSFETGKSAKMIILSQFSIKILLMNYHQ